jgi:hypothetical protein
MPTLAELTSVLFGTGSQGIIQDASFYSEATDRINAAVTAISAGLRMPDGQISPPLPDLYDMQEVTTSTTLPYVALPSDTGHVYQRGLHLVSDSNGNQLFPPNGGDYYAFKLFLKRAAKKDLSQSGAISMVCVKGSNLYYQGIPSAAVTLTLHFYREPVAMSSGTHTPDGIPSQYAERLIAHYVAKEILGTYVEDGDNNQATGFKYHTMRFFEAMTDLMDFIGIDAEPEYYGTGEWIDMGIVD